MGLTKGPVYENPGHHDPNYLPNRLVPFNSSKSVIPSNAEDLLNLARLILMIQKLDGQKLVKGKSLFGIGSKVVRQMVLVLFIGMVLQMVLILKADQGQ
ncbi:hypothetical protein E5831_18625 [Salmonella enterica]|nr:hypothetical protein [Salmonella enterica]